MEIVPAKTADEAAILPLMEAFNRAEGIDWRPVPMGAALRRLLGEPGLGLVLLARNDTSPTAAGYCLATFGFDIEFAGPDAFITEIFVTPACRNRGWGGALLDAAIDRLRRGGARAVHLMVRPENRRARALYENRGFIAAPRIMMTRTFEEAGA